MVGYNADGSRTVPVDFVGQPAMTTQWRNKTGKRLFLNADKSKVVEEGDKDAAFLLAAPGSTLSMVEAATYGLIDEPVESFLPPAAADAIRSRNANNLKAESDRLRHKAFVAGEVMSEDEGMAQAKKNLGLETEEDMNTAEPKPVGTTHDDVKPADDNKDTTAKSVSQTETRDKAVTGPDKTK